MHRATPARGCQSSRRCWRRHRLPRRRIRPTCAPRRGCGRTSDAPLFLPPVTGVRAAAVRPRVTGLPDRDRTGGRGGDHTRVGAPATSGRGTPGPGHLYGRASGRAQQRPDTDPQGGHADHRGDHPGHLVRPVPLSSDSAPARTARTITVVTRTARRSPPTATPPSPTPRRAGGTAPSIGRPRHMPIPTIRPGPRRRGGKPWGALGAMAPRTTCPYGPPQGRKRRPI